MTIQLDSSPTSDIDLARHARQLAGQIEWENLLQGKPLDPYVSKDSMLRIWDTWKSEIQNINPYSYIEDSLLNTAKAFFGVSRVSHLPSAEDLKRIEIIDLVHLKTFAANQKTLNNDPFFLALNELNQLFHNEQNKKITQDPMVSSIIQMVKIIKNLAHTALDKHEELDALKVAMRMELLAIAKTFYKNPLINQYQKTEVGKAILDLFKYSGYIAPVTTYSDFKQSTFFSARSASLKATSHEIETLFLNN